MHIVITGEGQSDATVYMIVDKRVTDTVEMAELPFASMAAFLFFFRFFHMFTGLLCLTHQFGEHAFHNVC